MPAFNEITPATLMRLIGTPAAPVLVDVSIDADHADDPFLVPTAFRAAHTDRDGLSARLAGRDCVVICQKGKKLSHGVAAWLRAQGIGAQVLEGGNYGWRDAGLPRVPAAARPAPLWVTRHRPKIDRIACPWLIRRFVDPAAQFLFVPPSEVPAVAEKFDATPFDIEDTHFSHRGPLCTFDTMIATFGLAHPALDRLALVVRAADTDDHAASPQAAGLLALSVGLSRMYRDDMAQLEAGMNIYDALYRWARDGFDEGHDWPAGAAK
ncbi:chromate resistance protein ChrB domain-containing protein [Octadecabacter sp. R77987]|uniref:chromate resistance protein ChrB domain-containing protein n=1 Tax=Octadecabacter sp. R77987 TaxID=3093874 RepID=UPI00366C95AF